MKTSRLFPFLILMLAAAGCERMEPGLFLRRSGDLLSREGRGRIPRGGEVTDSTGAPVAIPPDGLFVTAVAYPDGYDWRRDTARGSVRGQVLLLRLRDGAASETDPGTETPPSSFDTVLALEAGAGRAVSLDADRHQFIGGHLYTQCITEVGTIHRRDGQTVLISQEEEYLRGILLSGGAGTGAFSEPGGGTLYTLSQRLDGEGGFVLRRGWKPLLTRRGGRIHGSLGEPSFGRGGALFADGGEVCFFYENTDGDGTVPGGWTLVRCGNGSGDPSSGQAPQEVREVPVTLPDGITHLYDIRCYDGVICIVCRWKRREPVIFVGSKKYDLSTTLLTPASKSGFRLLHSDAGIRISGAVRLQYNGQLYTSLWSEKWLLATKAGHCDWWDPEFYVRRENGHVAETGLNGVFYPLDGGTLMMPACAFRNGPDLYLALTGSSTGNTPTSGSQASPTLWHNGKSIPLPLNGFPTSVILRQN